MMDARTFLEQAGVLEKRIRAKQEKLAVLRASATRTGALLHPAPGSPTRTAGGSGMSNAVDRIVDLERELDADAEQLAETKAEILRVIEAVPDTDCQYVLMHRYLLGENSPEIAAALHYSVRWVQKRHLRGLQAVEAVLQGR